MQHPYGDAISWNPQSAHRRMGFHLQTSKPEGVLDLSKQQLTSLIEFTATHHVPLTSYSTINLDFNFELSHLTPTELAPFSNVTRLSARGCNFRNIFAITHALRALPALRELCFQTRTEAKNRARTSTGREISARSGNSSLVILSRLLRMLGATSRNALDGTEDMDDPDTDVPGTPPSAAHETQSPASGRAPVQSALHGMPTVARSGEETAVEDYLRRSGPPRAASSPNSMSLDFPSPSSVPSAPSSPSVEQSSDASLSRQFSSSRLLSTGSGSSVGVGSGANIRVEYEQAPGPTHTTSSATITIHSTVSLPNEAVEEEGGEQGAPGSGVFQAHIRMLQHLITRGVMMNMHLCNSICAHPLYRAYLIHSLPSLRMLDWTMVTAQERRAAAELFGERVEVRPYDLTTAHVTTSLFARQIGLSAKFGNRGAVAPPVRRPSGRRGFRMHCESPGVAITPASAFTSACSSANTSTTVSPSESPLPSPLARGHLPSASGTPSLSPPDSPGHLPPDVVALLQPPMSAASSASANNSSLLALNLGGSTMHGVSTSGVSTVPPAAPTVHFAGVPSSHGTGVGHSTQAATLINCPPFYPELGRFPSAVNSGAQTPTTPAMEGVSPPPLSGTASPSHEYRQFYQSFFAPLRAIPRLQRVANAHNSMASSAATSVVNSLTNSPCRTPPRSSTPADAQPVGEFSSAAPSGTFPASACPSGHASAAVSRTGTPPLSESHASSDGSLVVALPTSPVELPSLHHQPAGAWWCAEAEELHPYGNRLAATPRGSPSAVATRYLTPVGIPPSCRPLVAARLAQPPYRISTICNTALKPRQFEYHPLSPDYLLLGTMSGRACLYNFPLARVVLEVDLTDVQERQNFVLGLCWMNQQPDKFLAGTDSGNISLFSFHDVSATQLYTYPKYTKLTCLHVNSTDDHFLASGYSNDVSLYDLRNGVHLRTLHSLHSRHINVLKFSHHTPWLFATSSFDRSCKLWDLRTDCSKPTATHQSGNGNVMCCFSADDRYLLSSAIDNDVRLLETSSLGLVRRMDVAPCHSGTNFTRSYFLNNSDYIIVGSYEEDCVHVVNAQSGKILQDVALRTAGGGSQFIQSLRGDPFTPFNFSVLVAHSHDTDGCDIVHVDMLSGPLDE
eukprot:TRINITY_DN6150_c0_g1_i1.p1 TRINITY_DN6150_c0_g1~~TRINITY_DN6150_c0_g1_i1.p1  ORF type:complete len:1133 (-),score=99.11 TRINITY_DN6150_c0_g1_i1:62-3460(-)